MKQYIVDAFAEKLFTGNQAGVVVCKNMPDDEIMTKIAMENNYAETAFVVKRHEKGNYNLKWFTPAGEIDLCGHATLATAFIIYNFVDKDIEKMTFHTLSGELIVTKNKNGYTLDFPVGKTKKIEITKEIIKASQGLAKEAYYDGGDIVVIIENEEDLANFIPNGEEILKLEGTGFIMTTKSKNYDFVSRCFYPIFNIEEDSVTGRAHTFMAPIWAEKLGKNEMIAKQISSRSGIVGVKLVEDRVYLTGNAQLFMEGEIPFDL